MAARVPQFALPFRVIGGEVVEVEQDSPEEIGQCVEAILRTPEGTRIDEPEFGRPDETFAQLSTDSNATQYVAAVERWEPRASVLGAAGVEGMAKRVIIEEGTE
jgi:phage baseplate assembly protein W